MSRAESPLRNRSLQLSVVIGAGFALLGVLLGFISLASQSVQEVRELPPEDVRDARQVYFVKGVEAPAATGWRTVRTALEEETPGQYTLTEGELNAWARSQMVVERPRGPTAEGAEGSAPTSLLGLSVHVSGLNFNLEGDRLQMGAYVEFPSLARGKRIIYRVRGRVRTAAGGGLRFVPEEGTFGRAPVVQIPLVGPLFHRALAHFYRSTPEARALAEHWSAIDTVALDDGELALTLR